jgi:uncharacterized protein (TIGR03437 family)
MNSQPLKTTILKYAMIAASLAAIPAAFSQTLTIKGGNGQLVGPTALSNQPLSVQLLDATGQPMSNQAISFVATNQAAGNPASSFVITDATGTASAYFIGASIQNTGIAYVPNTVVASFGALTAAFAETTVGTVAGGSGGTLVTSSVLSPAQGSGLVVSGTAGTTSTVPIQVRVQATTNIGVSTTGVPNVSLSVTIDTNSNASFTCKEGSNILTDFTGTATCTPVFGAVGTGTYTITVGGAYVYSSYPFSVTVGPPAVVVITSGNNQSGTPGSTLPLPLVGVVTDLGMNPIPGVAMVFTSVTPGGATFTNVRTTSDAAGKVSANVVLGSVPGAITISLADTGGLIKSPATFTATVILTITGLSKSAGDNQTAIVNSQFSSPLIVQVTAASGQNPQGTPVQFAVTSGSATVGSSTATVDANGRAQTTVTAGGTAGPVVITATSGSYSATFNLTVAPPGPSNITFTNNASGVLNSLSPGSVVTIYGTGIAPSVQGVIGGFVVGPLPYTVAGVSVKFGSFNAPIFGVGNTGGTQFVTVQVPFEVPFGAVPVTVTTAGGASATVQATLAAASPGLFEYIAGDGSKNVVALRPDGSVVGPSNRAVRGESLRFYVTGTGPLSPAVSTNSFSAAGSDPTVVYPIVLGISNNGTAYSQAIYARNLIGVEEITFTLPTDTATGPVGISIGVISPGGVVYSQGSVLYVSNQ